MPFRVGWRPSIPRLDHFQDLSYAGNISPGETSRTLNDVVPSPDNTHDLGKSTANGDSANERWKNLSIAGNAHIGGNLTTVGTFSGPMGNITPTSISTSQGNTTPVQIGSVWYPGTASGLVTPPAAAPVYSIALSGGSVADGTYYYKFAYKNLNGETTASPVATIVVAGGSGAATVYLGDAGNGDWGWITGAYGYRGYLSTDNINFHLQTSNPVAADFMVDATTHYVRMGSGHRITSYDATGASPPASNTATIDPLQVALNQTRYSAVPNVYGTLFVPAAFGKHGLTTPLIMKRGERMIGSATSSSVNTGATQSDIYNSSAWNNSKLAVVMNFGGDASIENIEIRGNATNPLMALGGGGYQAGFGGLNAKNSSFSALGSAATYSAFVGIGILYEVYFDSVYMRGDRSVVEYRNIAGGMHYYRNGRWDAGGASVMRNVVGWLNPDDGTGSSFFPNGLATVVVENIRTELGTGILFDCMNLSMKFVNINLADATIAGGTDSIAKFGTDVSFGFGAGSNIELSNASFGTANTRVGTNLIGGGFLNAYGNSSFGWGNNTGSQQTVDFNNSNQVTVYDSVGAIGSIDPAAAATTPHVINMNNSTALRSVFGDRGGGANVVATHALMGRLYLLHKTASTFNFANRLSILNNGGTQFEVRSDNDTEAALIVPTDTGASSVNRLATVAYSLRVGGSATNPALLIGPSSLTPAQATFNGLGLPNGYYLAWQNAANNATVLGWRLNTSDEMESQAPLGIMPLVNATPHGKAGKTWAYVGTLQGAVGGVTPATGAFTTVSASTSTTIGAGTAITKVVVYTPSLTPAAIAANTSAEQTFTVTGLTTGDKVFVNPPSLTAGTGIVSVRVTAADTIGISWGNFTVGALTPPAGTYKIVAVRS